LQDIIGHVRPPEARPARMIHGYIQGQAVDPGAQAAFPAECRERPVNPHEDLLRYVLCIRCPIRAQYRQCQSKDLVLVTRNDYREQPFVAVLQIIGNKLSFIPIFGESRGGHFRLCLCRAGLQTKSLRPASIQSFGGRLK
jgi:hypothetical protein